MGQYRGGLKVKTQLLASGWDYGLSSLSPIFKCYVGYDYFDFQKTFKKIESDLYLCVENNFCCYLESKFYFLPHTFKQNLMKFAEFLMNARIFQECNTTS